MYRGKEIFKLPNTGWIDENVACVREWAANIFFYRKGDVPIMIDVGYHYDRLDGQFRIRLRPQGPALLPIQKTRPRPRRPLHAYDESDDTPERAKAGLLKGVGR